MCAPGAGRPNPGQVGVNLHPPADHRRMDQVVVGIKADVVLETVGDDLAEERVIIFRQYSPHLVGGAASDRPCSCEGIQIRHWLDAAGRCLSVFVPGLKPALDIGRILLAVRA
jgi:hypothetical protein